LAKTKGNKVNMKARLRSKPFIAAIVSAIGVLVVQVGNAFGVDLSAQVEQGISIVASVVMVLVIAGIVIDPTVEGFGDSDLSLGKDRPSKQHTPVKPIPEDPLDPTVQDGFTKMDDNDPNIK